ncbi:MlaA family lipoprotein [Halioxenophilus aromaticivorans]|uniref:VacJ family lipoprotein n=1 Tax=Halioxenophilus aromaticivorans TaxID=1306992 RepID=A0AAV3TZJ2_9ALTE
MKIAVIAVLLVSLAACSSVPSQDVSAFEEPSAAAPEEKNRDPWEGFNRSMYRFNDALDRAILKPAAKGYKFVTPDPVEKGVSNVFSNLGEVSTILNSMLQWKWKSAAHSTGRFVVNSTLGIVGILDVAGHVGLEKRPGEDFGQTLATWGVGSGPFLVLPFFGPSTVRDGFGTVVDWYSDPVTYADLHSDTRWAIRGVRLVDQRARLLEVEELMSGDRYSFIRDAYLQNRDYLIKDGQVEDDFGGEQEQFDDIDGFDDIEF